MAKTLDEIDLQILSILEENAKARMHGIAKKLNVPQSTVHHRIKRMEKDGIISKWTILKDYEKMGLGVKAYILIFVNVTALKQMKKSQKDLAKRIRKFDNIEAVDIMAGEADLLVTARCSDLKSLQDVLLDQIQSIEGITKTKTMIVISEN
jgi:Lrp/AsnC family transcriptional regulator, regulator for asnA, asnC and gidA